MSVFNLRINFFKDKSKNFNIFEWYKLLNINNDNNSIKLHITHL